MGITSRDALDWAGTYSGVPALCQPPRHRERSSLCARMRTFERSSPYIDEQPVAQTEQRHVRLERILTARSP